MWAVGATHVLLQLPGVAIILKIINTTTNNCSMARHCCLSTAKVRDKKEDEQ